MPSNKETLFQDHICAFLEREHHYILLSAEDISDREFHIAEKYLIDFIASTQLNKYKEIEENFGNDTDKEIIKALRDEVGRKKLWLAMRDGLDVKGTKLELYKPKPRSNTSALQEENYQKKDYFIQKRIPLQQFN